MRNSRGDISDVLVSPHPPYHFKRPRPTVRRRVIIPLGGFIYERDKSGAAVCIPVNATNHHEEYAKSNFKGSIMPSVTEEDILDYQI